MYLKKSYLLNEFLTPYGTFHIVGIWLRRVSSQTQDGKVQVQVRQVQHLSTEHE